MTSSVFRRATDPPVAVRAEGVWVEDAAGSRYLDAAGGAIVVGIGHGDPVVAAAMAEQAGRLAYVHGSAFTTEALESYAAELAEVVPVPRRPGLPGERGLGGGGDGPQAGPGLPPGPGRARSGR